jgi:hypothetical protein
LHVEMVVDDLLFWRVVSYNFVYSTKFWTTSRNTIQICFRGNFFLSCLGGMREIVYFEKNVQSKKIIFRDGLCRMSTG